MDDYLGCSRQKNLILSVVVKLGTISVESERFTSGGGMLQMVSEPVLPGWKCASEDTRHQDGRL